MHTRNRFRRSVLGLLAGAALATTLAVQPIAMAGAPVTGDATVQAPTPRCVLDVAFVIDDTGSMFGAIGNIQAGINSIINNIVATSGGNYQLALLTFKDNVRVVNDLAPGNAGAVTASVNLLSAGGGGGEPEASDEALNTAINNLPAGPPRPQIGNFNGIWRSNAVKITVLVTDARPGGFDDTYTVGVDNVAAATRANQAQANGIRLSSVYIPTNPGLNPTIVPIMQNYANTTGGLYTQAAANGSGTATAIQQIIDNCRTRTDVYIRDYVGDVGVEPHSNAVWYSPDIKVCHTAVECPTSLNPIVGVTNYVFIKLNNPGPYGSGTGLGSVHLYRSTPGGGTNWPMHWTPIGVASGVTAPAGVTTVMIPWTGVPGPGHFCLLARWVSGTDPMTFPEGIATVLNAQRNNNIAWRNVDSVKLPPGHSTPRPFAIGNALDVETRNDLVLTQPEGAFQELGGRIVVDLGDDLFRRWAEAGQQGEGIRQVGETHLEIVDPRQARIIGLTLRPGERPDLTLIFSADPDARPGTTLLHVNQLGLAEEGGEHGDVGGVEYQLTIDRR